MATAALPIKKRNFFRLSDLSDLTAHDNDVYSIGTPASILGKTSIRSWSGQKTRIPSWQNNKMTMRQAS